MRQATLDGQHGTTRGAVLEEMRAEMQHALLSQTKVLERIAGLVTNHVLTCELIVIPAEGFVTRQWHLPCGSVAINLHTAGTTLTVVSGSATSEQAPTNGVSMGQVVSPAASVGAAVLNLSAHAITIYGPAAAKFTLQAFTVPQPPR
jgi:hypothetical protein